MANPTDTLLNGLGACPVPKSDYDRILLGHGSGGRLTADLIQRVFVPGFANDVLSALEDQATLRDCRLQIADCRLEEEVPRHSSFNLQSAICNLQSR